MDSKASLTAAVIMLGSIKSSDCSPYVGNDNDHGYLPIWSIVFRLCKDRGFFKHRINSPIDEKMKDPATKNDGSNKQQLQAKRMRKTRSAVKFIVRVGRCPRRGLPPEGGCSDAPDHSSRWTGR